MAVEKESKPEDLLDGADTENVESDSQTSAGEEIPEALEIEGGEIEEGLLGEDETPTPSEPEKAPAEAGEPPLSPIEQAFKDKGLDKQFKDVEDMMNRVPEMNRYINDLGVKNKELGKLQEQAPPVTEPEKAPSADDFYNDPVSVIQKMVDKRQDEYNQRFDDMEMDAFKSSKSDYRDMEPLMEEALLDNPGMRALGVKALEPLYLMAKAKQLSKMAVNPPTKPAPNKASAETSVGKKSVPVDKDKAYYEGRSLKQLEDELGVTSQYKD